MEDILRRCLNWKVAAALGGVGVAIWALAPGLVAQAIPLLVVLVCPISMLLMMRGMDQSERSTPGRVNGDGGAVRLPELRSELASTRARQELLIRQIARLEASGTAGDPPREEQTTR